MVDFTCKLTDLLVLVGILATTFAILCAIADYAIPCVMGLRRRKHHPNKITHEIGEDWK